MIKAALAKPIAVIVALLGIVVFSVLALGRIPVDIFPRLNLPTIYIAARISKSVKERAAHVIA